MVRVIINGICGRLGQTTAELILAHADQFTLVAGIDVCECSEKFGVPIYHHFKDVAETADVIIDFSAPAAMAEMLTYCKTTGTRAVIGTTGLGETERLLIERAAETTAIFHSGNMSLGVNLQIELIAKAAAALGDSFDVEIIEKHHNHKADAPSGTALMLANAISTQYATPRTFQYGRHSIDQRRRPTEIGMHSIRGGTLVGEHAVLFIGQDEVLEVTHKAYSKQIFAAGALRAALYLMTKQSGVYNMHDIVTESDVLSHLYTEDGQSVITISGLPHHSNAISRVFSLIAEHRVFVDMISIPAPASGSMKCDISFSLPRTQLATALNALKTFQRDYPDMDVYTVDNITKLTVEGPGMALRHGVAAQFFTVLANADVSIELITTSETKIACCVPTLDVPAAVDAISSNFPL